MKMIQNSLKFQDAAPVVPSQLGKGALSALRSTGGNGLFAELLQGKQSPQDGAAAQADPQEDEAQQPSNSRPGVRLRLQNSFGKPASAAGDTQGSQAAVNNLTTFVTAGQGEAQKNSGNPLQSLRWQDARLAASGPPMGKLNVPSNAPVDLQTKVQANLSQKVQTNTPQNVQPNDQANVQPNAQPNPQANVQLSAQSNAQQNVEASMQVNTLPNAQPNLQPILSPNLKPMDMQQLPQSLLQDQPQVLQNQSNQLIVQGQAPEESAGQSVAAAPVTAKGLDKQNKFAGLRRVTLAGEAQLAAGLSDTLQVKGAILASAGEADKKTLPAAGGAKGTEPEKQNLSARDSLAADTRNTAPITDALQGLAAVSLATAKDAGLVATLTDSKMSNVEQSAAPIDMPVGRATAMPVSAPIVAGTADTAGPAVLTENSAPARKDFGPAIAAYHLKPEVAAAPETVSREVPTVAATEALFGKGMAPKEAAATGKIMGQGTSPALATPAQETAAAYGKPEPLPATRQILNGINVPQAKTSPLSQNPAAEPVLAVQNGANQEVAASPAEESRSLHGSKVPLTTANPVFSGRAGEQIEVSKRNAPVHTTLQEARPDVQVINATANPQSKTSPVGSVPGAEQVVDVVKGPGLNSAASSATAPRVAKAQGLEEAGNQLAKAIPVTSGGEAEQGVVSKQGLAAETALPQNAAQLAANTQSINDAKASQTVAGPVEAAQTANNGPVQNTVAQNASASRDAAAPQAKPLNLHEVKNLQDRSIPVTSGREAEQAAVVEKEPRMDSAALDQAVKAAPALTEGPQNADPKNSTVQPAGSGAPEREQQVLAASDGIAKTPTLAGPNGTSSPTPQAGTEAAEAASQPDRLAQVPTDTRGPRAAMGFHGTYAAVRNVTEQADSKQNAPVEELGTKTATTAATAKFVPFQGSAGQNAFSDSEKKGHPEQKAQAAASASAQPQGVGLPIEPAATAAPLPEAKPVNLKSALHESILSQIKDGVVTQDSKGNGQMSIRLNPGELGELKIQVRMDDNKLHVEVHADNKMVKDLLMSNLDSLKDSLTSKNFTMEGFDVSTGGGFNSPLPEQKENPRQQAFLRSARAGAYPDQGEETKVNYLTGEVNNLLDVRF
jgi:flagellar hook-length control protein FliK